MCYAKKKNIKNASRNNSATQADYKTPPPATKAIGPPSSGTPFKPVPPPKPKNYRPPIQGGNVNHWDNGPEPPTSPRSPNGFFYPPTPSHYHHSSHNTPSSPNSGHGGPPPPQFNQQYSGNGNYSGGTQMSYGGGREPPPNGYNGGNHAYGGQYMHRNPPGMSMFENTFV